MKSEMSVPRAIIAGSSIIALSILFRADESFSIIEEANAEVAGMDAYDLKYDYDFKKGVQAVVEDCDVSGEVDSYGDVDASIDC